MEPVVRTFRPTPPAERPRHRRRTARVLLTDDRGRVLLFRDSDPGVPGRTWWMTPGGGIDPGESDLEAAVRELAEETGLRITAADLVGPLLVRPVLHGYSDIVIDQVDVWFGCHVPAFEVDDAGHTDEERLTMTAHRWWTRAEVAATTEEVWPADLLDLWDDADARRGAAFRGEPGRPAADGAAIEESTVPVT